MTDSAPSTVLILSADSGSAIPLPASTDSSVRHLQMKLEAEVAMPSAQQILLLEGIKLEEDRALGEYGLPVADPRSRPVFLFGRRALSKTALPPERQPVHPLDIELAAELPAAQHRLISADMQALLDTSPLIHALDYERHFLDHVHARAFVETARPASRQRALSPSWVPPSMRPSPACATLPTSSPSKASSRRGT